MGALEMQKNELIVDENNILEVFQLKNILHLYEELEIKVEDIEIENINQKYIEGKEQKMIKLHLSSLEEKLKRMKQEVQDNIENEKQKGKTIK